VDVRGRHLVTNTGGRCDLERITREQYAELIKEELEKTIRVLPQRAGEGETTRRAGCGAAGGRSTYGSGAGGG